MASCIDFLEFVEMMEVVRIVVVRIEIVVEQEECVDSSMDTVEEYLVAIDSDHPLLMMDEHQRNVVGSLDHLEEPWVR